MKIKRINSTLNEWHYELIEQIALESMGERSIATGIKIILNTIIQEEKLGAFSMQKIITRVEAKHGPLYAHLNVGTEKK